MKRSDFYIRVISVVLFLAVASYIGVYIYNATLNSYDTTTAISYSIDEAFSAQGYFVRTETVLSDGGATALPTVGEGEKVASGQAIAVEYMNREALEAAGDIHNLKLMIAQLEASAIGDTRDASFESVMALSSAVQSRDLSNLDELSLMIETYIFSGDSSPASELPILREQLEILENRIVGVRTIRAPMSGIFSHTVDGFEHIDPKAVLGLLPSRLISLFAYKSGAYGMGKLVTEYKWYFASIMDAKEAAHLSAGTRIPVRFSGAYNEIVDMDIESVGNSEDGNCVVLFSSDQGIHEVAPLRYLRADIIAGLVTGLRIPKEAIHLDDNATTFVYLQTGVRAERVDVEILYEEGEAYLVRDGGETGSALRAGSTIIVKANDLYDGKIVA